MANIDSRQGGNFRDPKGPKVRLQSSEDWHGNLLLRTGCPRGNEVPTTRGSARPTAEHGLRAKLRHGWASLGVRRARLGGSAVFVDGACEDGENSPARDEAPTTLPMSGRACLEVPSPTTRRTRPTFPKSGLPDCQSGRDASLRNTMLSGSDFRGTRYIVTYDNIYYVPVVRLELANSATFPKSGLPRPRLRLLTLARALLLVVIARAVPGSTTLGWGEGERLLPDTPAIFTDVPPF